MIWKGLFEATMPWLDPGSDKWSLVEKETPSPNFIEDFGLVNLYKDLGMSSIFWSIKPRAKATYGTLMHIV